MNKKIESDVQGFRGLYSGITTAIAAAFVGILLKYQSWQT
jgi:hypothetical protein